MKTINITRQQMKFIYSNSQQIRDCEKLLKTPNMPDEFYKRQFEWLRELEKRGKLL